MKYESLATLIVAVARGLFLHSFKYDFGKVLLGAIKLALSEALAEMTTHEKFLALNCLSSKMNALAQPKQVLGSSMVLYGKAYNLIFIR